MSRLSRISDTDANWAITHQIKQNRILFDSNDIYYHNKPVFRDLCISHIYHNNDVFCVIVGLYSYVVHLRFHRIKAIDRGCISTSYKPRWRCRLVHRELNYKRINDSYYKSIILPTWHNLNLNRQDRNATAKYDRISAIRCLCHSNENRKSGQVQQLRRGLPGFLADYENPVLFGSACWSWLMLMTLRKEQADAFELLLVVSLTTDTKWSLNVLENPRWLREHYIFSLLIKFISPDVFFPGFWRKLFEYSIKLERNEMLRIWHIYTLFFE